MTALLLIGWMICGIINYGLIFAYFQEHYKIIADETYYNDMILAAISSLLGPFDLFATLLCGFYVHGFKWK